MEENAYYNLGAHLRELFGERVHKIALDAGLTCPNRDGTRGVGGCIYCNARGSGTGAAARGLGIPEQMEASRERLEKRFNAKKFIAYFQSFSNTYGPRERLRAVWEEALAFPRVVGLSVGTRPDCVDEGVLSLLKEVAAGRLLWLELGLQSASDETLRLINRGHDVDCFERACALAASFGIPVVAHVILGLPGEGLEDVRRTAGFLNRVGVAGVKIHLLYVVRGTRLGAMFERGDYTPLTREQYLDMLVDFLGRLDPETVIHRLTGDPHPQELLAPRWALDKKKNLAALKRALGERGVTQGSLLGGGA